MLFEYLTRGVKAGVVAGLVFGLFVALVANPLVGYADATTDDHSHDHESSVSPVVTTTVSVLSGALWAVLLGGVVFGLAFYLLEPAIPGAGATKSYLLGLAGFVTVSGAPWLVLPPVSPGAQQSLAVGTRLGLYAGMMVAGAAVCLLSGYSYRRLSATGGRPLGAVAGVASFGLLGVPVALAPTNTVQGALSPTLQSGLVGLFAFGQLLVWLVLAATHAQLRRSADGRSVRSSADTGGALGAD